MMGFFGGLFVLGMFFLGMVTAGKKVLEWRADAHRLYEMLDDEQDPE